MKKGFTLIELLAVILILGIIALIAIPAVTNVIEDSKKNAAEVTAMHYIKSINDQNALYKLQPDKFTPITSGDVEDIEVNLKGEGPTEGEVTIENGKVTEAELCASGYTVTYNGVSTTVEGKCGTSSGGLLYYIDKITETGIYKKRINNVTYDLNVIVLNGDQTITTNTTYGTLDDCASGTDASQMATRMVVVKVNGDYTVNSNVTVAPAYHTLYGGPKGFLLYVTGTLTNNGTIDNSHGAYALGQDVYLWKNSNGTYEYVPAVGAAGGLGIDPANTSKGQNGANGANRQTGGGGGGRLYGGGYDRGSDGTAGTSYSGGTGGSTGNDSPGSPNGGAGGVYYGAGNPGNNPSNGTAPQNGTGGLLIIYANNFINNSTLSAHGYNGGKHSYQGGGSSGGGSINVFYKGTLTEGNTNVTGGNRANDIGGAGGTGTVTYTQIN